VLGRCDQTVCYSCHLLCFAVNQQGLVASRETVGEAIQEILQWVSHDICRRAKTQVAHGLQCAVRRRDLVQALEPFTSLQCCFVVLRCDAVKNGVAQGLVSLQLSERYLAQLESTRVDVSEEHLQISLHLSLVAPQFYPVGLDQARND
jgi:hypothetical protein